MGTSVYRDIKYLFEVLITVWRFGNGGSVSGRTRDRQRRYDDAAEPNDSNREAVSALLLRGSYPIPPLLIQPLLSIASS